MLFHNRCSDASSQEAVEEARDIQEDEFISTSGSRIDIRRASGRTNKQTSKKYDNSLTYPVIIKCQVIWIQHFPLIWINLEMG